MDDFEKRLLSERGTVERFVRFRLSDRADAEDVIQEIFLTAYEKYDSLRNKDSFKAWILGIARNKCHDYFRRVAARHEISLERVTEKVMVSGKSGLAEVSAVRETLALLGDKDKQILYLYFWEELPQVQIAERLGIPVGTVKSRLYTAKRNFRNQYPYPPRKAKGENTMKRLPEILPEYKIEKSTDAPFSVKWEEIMGWFIVPKENERIRWGIYDMPSRKCDCLSDVRTKGRVRIHGVTGIEIEAKEISLSEESTPVEHSFVAQLTDTHCRYLAAVREKDGVKELVTFLDGEEFASAWGIGEDNVGCETMLYPRGNLQRCGNDITVKRQTEQFDLIGRCRVTIGSESYDTVCAMYIADGVAIEQYLDTDGRTVLWRRFNHDTWGCENDRRPWSERLPENEKLTVDGEIYVHWYDCITDRVL